MQEKYGECGTRNYREYGKPFRRLKKWFWNVCYFFEIYCGKIGSIESW